MTIHLELARHTAPSEYTSQNLAIGTARWLAATHAFQP